MRIESSFDKIIKKKEARGLVKNYSVEASQRMDRVIADAFEKAGKEAEKRQRQSWAIMANKIWR